MADLTKRAVADSGSAAAHDHYLEAGTFIVIWRVPASALTEPGQRFLSTSAVVTGRTSATFGDAPARSCHGSLTAGRKRLDRQVRLEQAENPPDGGLDL